MTFPDVDTLDTYGGALNDAQPVEDPTTDRPATGANQAYASTAALTHTGYVAWARFTTAATTGAMTLVSSDAAWGNDPSIRPVPARTSTGHFTLTWPTSTTDALGATHTTNIRRVRATVEGSTLAHAIPGFSAANIATIATYTSGAASDDLVGTVIMVEIG